MREILGASKTSKSKYKRPDKIHRLPVRGAGIASGALGDSAGQLVQTKLSVPFNLYVISLLPSNGQSLFIGPTQ